MSSLRRKGYLVNNHECGNNSRIQNLHSINVSGHSDQTQARQNLDNPHTSGPNSGGIFHWSTTYYKMKTLIIMCNTFKKMGNPNTYDHALFE